MIEENGQVNDFSEEKVVSSVLVKCKNCGANMVFDPNTQSLFCSHCESRISFDDDSVGKEIELSIKHFNDNSNQDDESVVFSCENCNAKIVLNKNQTSTNCPFCGTSHVNKTENLKGIKPNAIIPFNFDGEKAVQFAKKWAKKRLYAPKKFKKNLSAENVKGVYYPSFTFDSYTDSVYDGRIGKTHTRTVGSGKNKRVETYTVWRNISGTFYSRFDDVLISAGEKIDQRSIDKLSPFTTNESKQYQENYLLGFLSYHYDKNIETCWDDAKSIIDRNLRSQILSQYSYDKVAYLNVSTKHSNVTFKYLMLPVYIGNFLFRKKRFNFYINGRTGRVVGKTPVSILKVLFTIFCSVGLLVLLYFLMFN